MFDFLWIQYRLGAVTGAQLREFVPRWIAMEQYEQITGEEYA